MSTEETKGLSRRHFMQGVAVGGVALGAGAVLTGSTMAKAEGKGEGKGGGADASAELAKVLKGKKPVSSGGKIKVTGPAIAENGAVVPITIEMADTEKAKTIYLFVDKNPNPLAAKLTIKAAAPYFSTNIRMKSTSTVRGIVEMADGKLLETTRSVKVTIGGCGG